MNDDLMVEYNYDTDGDKIGQVWFSLEKNTITKFESFVEFLQFVYAMEEMAEIIAEEMGIDLEYYDDDDDTPTTNVSKFLN